MVSFGHAGGLYSLIIPPRSRFGRCAVWRVVRAASLPAAGARVAPSTPGRLKSRLKAKPGEMDDGKRECATALTCGAQSMRIARKEPPPTSSGAHASKGTGLHPCFRVQCAFRRLSFRARGPGTMRHSSSERRPATFLEHSPQASYCQPHMHDKDVERRSNSTGSTPCASTRAQPDGTLRQDGISATITDDSDFHNSLESLPPARRMSARPTTRPRAGL